jgi:ApaG protein
LETIVTNGIKVCVETTYHEQYSRPIEYKYVFAYRITIENMSEYTVQLMRRHWYIFDSNGSMKEVEGEGVVGQQPLLAPGDKHHYVSWSHLFTEFGKMHGYYLFTRHIDNFQFKATIPEFQLIAPYKMN